MSLALLVAMALSATLILAYGHGMQFSQLGSGLLQCDAFISATENAEFDPRSVGVAIWNPSHTTALGECVLGEFEKTVSCRAVGIPEGPGNYTCEVEFDLGSHGSDYQERSVTVQ
jgi:hypothetical protein